MRNEWFPQSKAAYIPLEEQKKLGLKTAVISRKYNYQTSYAIRRANRTRNATPEVHATSEAQIEADRISVRTLSVLC